MRANELFKARRCHKTPEVFNLKQIFQKQNGCKNTKDAHSFNKLCGCFHFLFSVNDRCACFIIDSLPTIVKTLRDIGNCDAQGAKS